MNPLVTSRPAAPTCSRRGRLCSAAGLAVALALSSPAAAQASRVDESRTPPPPPIGTQFDLPKLTMLDGCTLRPVDLARRVAVVYCLASWCPLRALQSPLINRLQRIHGSRGLRVVGLLIDKKPENATAHLAKKGHDLRLAWVSLAIAVSMLKPKGLPVTVVLGRDGRMLISESGQLFAEAICGITRFL